MKQSDLFVDIAHFGTRFGELLRQSLLYGVVELRRECGWQRLHQPAIKTCYGRQHQQQQQEGKLICKTVCLPPATTRTSPAPALLSASAARRAYTSAVSIKYNGLHTTHTHTHIVILHCYQPHTQYSIAYRSFGNAFNASLACASARLTRIGPMLALE